MTNSNFPGNRITRPLPLLLCTLLLLFTIAGSAFASVPAPLTRMIAPHLAAHPGKSGAYVLKKGEESLLARAWLTDHATTSIDVQYFIWNSDNIGILASEALLRAAAYLWMTCRSTPRPIPCWPWPCTPISTSASTIPT